jgi:hypothetical protein
VIDVADMRVLQTQRETKDGGGKEARNQCCGHALRRFSVCKVAEWDALATYYVIRQITCMMMVVSIIMQMIMETPCFYMFQAAKHMCAALQLALT